MQTVDPVTLHLGGEFIESNLGTARRTRRLGHRPRRSASNIPSRRTASSCPTDTPVTFRATSADVVHGLLITGTTINLMLVPGYISVIPARSTRRATA